MRRGTLLAVGVLVLGIAAAARAEQKRSEQVLNSVVGGLLGVPQQAAPSPDAVYSAQERDLLASLLQSGEYATARQGEPIDRVVYGVPLTRAEHVYTAKPIPASQTGFRQAPQQ